MELAIIKPGPNARLFSALEPRRSDRARDCRPDSRQPAM